MSYKVIIKGENTFLEEYKDGEHFAAFGPFKELAIVIQVITIPAQKYILLGTFGEKTYLEAQRKFWKEKFEKELEKDGLINPKIIIEAKCLIATHKEHKELVEDLLENEAKLKI